MCSLTGQPEDTGEVWWGQWGLDLIHYGSTYGLVTLLRVWFIVGYVNPGQSLGYYLYICSCLVGGVGFSWGSPPLYLVLGACSVCVECVWSACGVCVECVWSVCGVCVVEGWLKQPHLA